MGLTIVPFNYHGNSMLLHLVSPGFNTILLINFIIDSCLYPCYENRYFIVRAIHVCFL